MAEEMSEGFNNEILCANAKIDTFYLLHCSHIMRLNFPKFQRDWNAVENFWMALMKARNNEIQWKWTILSFDIGYNCEIL